MKTYIITFILFTTQWLFLVNRSYAQPGSIDATFNTADEGFGKGIGADNTVFVSSVFSNGKILIAGGFTTYNRSGSTNLIARLNIDGSLDTTFKFPYPLGNPVYSFTIQPDGKIIIGGNFATYMSLKNKVSRLNSDGSIDLSFTPGTGADNDVWSTLLQSDNKIIISGAFTTFNSTSRQHIARLNNDGTLDAFFIPGSGTNGIIYASALQADGKIIIGGDFTDYNGTAIKRIARLNSDGSQDPSFDPGTGLDSLVESIVLQNDGKILIGGKFIHYNGTVMKRLARLNTDGSLDTAFHPGVGADSVVEAIAVQTDGKILIGGKFAQYNSTSINRLARLNPDGSIDTSFHTGRGADNTFRAIIPQSDDKILIGGDFTDYNGFAIVRMGRLEANGSVDTSFNNGSGANNYVYSCSLQSDSSIIIGGSFSGYNGTTGNGVVRLHSDGSLDTLFNHKGRGTNNRVYVTAIQTDGKILIGGGFTSYNDTVRNYITRLNTDGSLDTSFNALGTGANSFIFCMAVQSDGKILIGGGFTTYNNDSIYYLARLNSDGTRDIFFNPVSGPNSGIDIITVQSDGKIMIGGSFTMYNGLARGRIARLNSNGSLDPSFNPSGSGANTQVEAITVQSDGKIIIGGFFTTYNGTTINRIARLNSDGSLDGSFNPGTGTSSLVGNVLLQSDGKIILVGSFLTFNGVTVNRLVRLNSNGSMDASFTVGTGPNGSTGDAVFQKDGKILVGGLYTAFNSVGKNNLVRLLGDGDGVGVAGKFSSPLFKIFPNPSAESFTIEMKEISNNTSLKIFNVMGQEVYEVAVGSSSKLEIQTGNLAKGIYFVQVRNEEKQYTQKLIIE